MISRTMSLLNYLNVQQQVQPLLYSTIVSIVKFYVTIIYYASCKDSVGCDHPSAQLNDSHIIIMGYNEISMGITVILSCPTGLVLTGPNSSRCMGNGEWEPNPREAECKGEKNLS